MKNVKNATLPSTQSHEKIVYQTLHGIQDDPVHLRISH